MFCSLLFSYVGFLRRSFLYVMQSCPDHEHLLFTCSLTIGSCYELVVNLLSFSLLCMGAFSKEREADVEGGVPSEPVVKKKWKKAVNFVGKDAEAPHQVSAVTGLVHVC